MNTARGLGQDLVLGTVQQSPIVAYPDTSAILRSSQFVKHFKDGLVKHKHSLLY